MNIKEITLLSAKQYEKYKHLIPVISTGRWWLKSIPEPFVSPEIDCVFRNSIQSMAINSADGFVRPALIIENLNKSPGDIISLLGHDWVVLDKDLILCEKYIGNYHYDRTYIHWPNSELRKWLYFWYRKEYKKCEIHIAITNETEFLLFKSFCTKNNKKIIGHDSFKDLTNVFPENDVFYFNFVPHLDFVHVKTRIAIDDRKMTFSEFCDYITKENNECMFS